MFEALQAAARKLVLREEWLVPLPEQRFAAAAAQRVAHAARGGDSHGRLTSLIGPSGSGKSLLLRAAVRQALREHPRLRIAWLSGQDWLLHLLRAQREQALAEFTEKSGRLQLVVCEDLDQIELPSEPAELITPWLDALLAHDVRVVATLQAAPAAKHILPPRLVSRLHGGLCASISRLSLESRRLFIREAAAQRHLLLSDDVAVWLADQGPGVPRALLQSVHLVAQAAQREQRLPDLPRVRHWLRQAVKAERPSLSLIAAAVADEFAVTTAELRSESRHLALRVPRQCAMYLAHEVGGWSMEEIGRYFGRRTHTSVSHSCRRLQELLPEAPSLREQVQRLQARLDDRPQTDCA